MRVEDDVLACEGKLRKENLCDSYSIIRHCWNYQLEGNETGVACGAGEKSTRDFGWET
jgi:hypothetical protein